MVTRSTDPLKYVIDTIFTDAKAKKRIEDAMEEAGVTKIDEFLELSMDDLVSLEWTVPAEAPATGLVVTHLRIAERNNIIAIQKWYNDQTDTSDAKILSLTAETLREHRRASGRSVTRRIADTATATTDAAAATLVATMAASSKSYVLLSADEFHKTVKRDITQYATFKDSKQWNLWYRGFVAIAKAQGLGNVLKPNYVPSTADEQALFDVLQEHMFAVFSQTLRKQARRICYGPSLASQLGKTKATRKSYMWNS